MDFIDWIAFAWMLPFAFFGWALHALTKLAQARTKKDFQLTVFWDREKLGWLLAVMWTVAGCYFVVRLVGVVPAELLEVGGGVGAMPDIIAFLIGLSGGSIGRNVAKWLTAKKT